MKNPPTSSPDMTDSEPDMTDATDVAPDMTGLGPDVTDSCPEAAETGPNVTDSGRDVTDSGLAIPNEQKLVQIFRSHVRCRNRDDKDVEQIASPINDEITCSITGNIDFDDETRICRNGESVHCSEHSRVKLEFDR